MHAKNRSVFRSMLVADRIIFEYGNKESDHLDPAQEKIVSYINVEDQFRYFGFCDDFGPLCIATVVEFCNTLNSHLEIDPEQQVVVVASSKVQSLTNSVFLLGAYLIVSHHLQLKSVQERLEK